MGYRPNQMLSNNMFGNLTEEKKSNNIIGIYFYVVTKGDIKKKLPNMDEVVLHLNKKDIMATKISINNHLYRSENNIIIYKGYTIKKEKRV